MPPIRALIIEDESPAARRLVRLLADLDPEIEILETIESVQDAVVWLKAHAPDLIFLDIHLADGLSFSIFEKVKVKAPIIFTTAYDQYAIRAFKLNSLDYLLKPVEAEELSMALDKYRRQKLALPDFDVQMILDALHQPGQTFQKRFMVTSGDKIRSIPVEEVAYFFGQQKYVFLTTIDGRRHLLDHTLTQLEDLLDPAKYFRINRQFIVGYQAIKHMFPHSKSRIRIELEPTPDIEAVVSIEKTPRFREWLNH
ncbi:MAG: LytTR family DNA-binding domain-containing protein [Bacteroidia bacterium]|nr:LytTR family DNA-binding domain-containing protein [Bacteroidia bacterium]